jgi:hypothetical protein
VALCAHAEAKAYLPTCICLTACNPCAVSLFAISHDIPLPFCLHAWGVQVLKIDPNHVGALSYLGIIEQEYHQKYIGNESTKSPCNLCFLFFMPARSTHLQTKMHVRAMRIFICAWQSHTPWAVPASLLNHLLVVCRSRRVFHPSAGHGAKQFCGPWRLRLVVCASHLWLDMLRACVHACMRSCVHACMQCTRARQQQVIKTCSAGNKIVDAMPMKQRGFSRVPWHATHSMPTIKLISGSS